LFRERVCQPPPLPPHEHSARTHALGSREATMDTCLCKGAGETDHGDSFCVDEVHDHQQLHKELHFHLVGRLCRSHSETQANNRRQE
jgi:hypothetical protein